MTSAERVAVVGTGLIGTSIAMAAVRAGETVRGFNADPDLVDQVIGAVPKPEIQKKLTALAEVISGAR